MRLPTSLCSVGYRDSSSPCNLLYATVSVQLSILNAVNVQPRKESIYILITLHTADSVQFITS